MSKLTKRNKKDIFYPSTGLEQNRNKKPVKELSGENTSKIKKDKSGKDYSLIQETNENFFKGDTIRPGNLPRVENFIKGGDYKVSETPESTTRATDEPRTFSPVKLENNYSSMKSMGQAVAQWTSPVRLVGEDKKTSSVDYAMSKGWGSKDKTGKFTLSPEGAKKFTEWKKSNKGKDPEPTATKTKTPAKNTQKTTINKSEEEPLERIKKREPGAIIDKDKERRDNERMQKAVELANASETLLKGKEKRKVAKYDRQDGRNSDESKLKRKTKATKAVQTLGSLLVDIGKPTSKIKKAGVAAETPEEKPKAKKPLTVEKKNNEITANIVDFKK